jgi:hypothetical protein
MGIHSPSARAYDSSHGRVDLEQRCTVDQELFIQDQDLQMEKGLASVLARNSPSAGNTQSIATLLSGHVTM